MLQHLRATLKWSQGSENEQEQRYAYNSARNRTSKINPPKTKSNPSRTAESDCDLKGMLTHLKKEHVTPLREIGSESLKKRLLMAVIG